MYYFAITNVFLLWMLLIAILSDISCNCCIHRQTEKDNNYNNPLG